MKTGRRQYLAALVALCMILSLLPVAGAATAPPLPTEPMRLEAFPEIEVRGDGIRHILKMTIDMDFASRKAVAFFSREELSPLSDYAIKQYPNAQAIHDLLSAAPMSGKATYTITESATDTDTCDLVDPVWDGEPFLWNVDKKSMQKIFPTYICIDDTSNRKYGDTVYLSIHDAEYYTYFFLKVRTYEKNYVLQRDNFSFPNSFSSFYKGSPAEMQGPSLVYRGSDTQPGANGYYVKPTTYEALTKDLPNSSIAAINNCMNEPFRGNCFGMAALSTLLFQEKLSLSQLSNSAKTAYELEKPINNDTLREAILFYQLTQLNNLITHSRITSGYDTKVNGPKLKYSLTKLSRQPLLITFRAETSERSFSHAVLAYTSLSLNDGYQITCYDPNSPTQPLFLTLNNDLTSASFDRTYTKVELGASFDSSAFENAPFNSSLKPPQLPADSKLITANTETMTIQVGNQSTQFTKGQTQAGANGVQCLGPLQGQDESPQIIYYIPPTKEPITITPVKDPSEPNVVVDVLTLGNNGSFTSVDSNGDFDVEMTSTKIKAKAKQGAKRKIRLAHAANQNKGPLFSTTIESTTTDITITPEEDGATVETGDGAEANIIASGKTESVTFEKVDTKKPVEVSSTNKEVKLESDSKTISSATASTAGTTKSVEPTTPTTPTTPTPPTTPTTPPTTPTQPQPPLVDTSAVPKQVKSAATDLSKNIVASMQAAEKTANSFVALGKSHSSWARNELARANALNLIPSSLLSKLNKNITRGEFAELLYQTVKSATGMSDADLSALSRKPDNAYASEYATPAIQFAYGCGIVNGYTDGSFAPNKSITRSEAAKMLVCMAELLGKNTSESGAKSFVDAPNDWSQSYINKISSISSPYSGLKVMGGDEAGRFTPRANYTCEQAIATMLRIIENVTGEAASYKGGVIAPPTTPTPPATNDPDRTGFVPKDWSWEAEGEGYGLTHFTSGKYVRSDGNAVLYIESASSPDGFSYQIYALPGGSKAADYTAPNDWNGPYSYSYANAEITSNTKAADNRHLLFFTSHGKTIDVETDWLDLDHLYGPPSGTYQLVREKK